MIDSFPHMRTLYHYTSLDAAVSILSDPSGPTLRFYDIQSMDDKTELGLGASHLLYQLEHNKELPLCKSLLALFETLEERQFETDIFSVSCSSSGRNQFLWENYASGGVCLELIEDYSISINNQVDIYDVYYSDGESSAALIAKLSILEGVLESLEKPLAYYAENNPTIIKEFTSNMLHIAAFVKHIDYWKEEERRLVIRAEKGKVEVDEKGRKYITVPVNSFGKIKELRYSPSAQKNTAWKTVKALADEQGIGFKEFTAGWTPPSRVWLDVTREYSRDLLENTPFRDLSKL